MNPEREAPRGQRILFHGGSVFDGTGVGPERADVVVADGRIIDLGLDLDGDVGVDVRGQSIMPGMIDCHVHVMMVGRRTTSELMDIPFSYRFFEAARNLEITLHAGITTVRDAAGADRGLQLALRDGLLRGPRMQLAIAMISQTGGHADDMQPCGIAAPVRWPPYPGMPRTVADGPTEIRRVVRQIARAGADWVKVAATGGFSSPLDSPLHAHYDDEELTLLRRTADAVKCPVMAHAQGLQGVKNAIRAGVRSIEHGVWLDDEAVDLMVAHGTWLVPTLLVPVWARRVGRGQAKIDIDATIEAHATSFRKAVDAGVRVAMGTDCGIVTHGENLGELELMAANGMTPTQALVTATARGAELLGLSNEIGTIEVGKRADLIVVEGNPTELSGLRSRIRDVYQDGALAFSRDLQERIVSHVA